jgi:hypothetical protein
LTKVGTAPEDTLSKTQTSEQEEEEEEEEASHPLPFLR